MQIITEDQPDTTVVDPSARVATFSVDGAMFTAHSRFVGGPVSLRYQGQHFHMGEADRSDWAEKAAAAHHEYLAAQEAAWRAEEDALFHWAG